MVYIYLPAAYYHLKLDVTKDNLLAAGFSRLIKSQIGCIWVKEFKKAGVEREYMCYFWTLDQLSIEQK